ncbi:ubiquinone/menaquinone biosynthesis C-methylase UbiE [Catenulispora sp. MAP12-49]|uniref:class I SAM-dependent DNA methyltransferase n=1 Tax=unclassified Catenulispora TaxID=414885 RepID=UPI003517D25D
MVIGNPRSSTPHDQAWLEREQAQARAYDAIGARYDEAFPHKDGQLAVVSTLLEQLPAGARVLDVGAGTGLPTARQLADAGCRVTCLDISPRMLEIARKNVPEAECVLGDVVDLSPPEPGYEAVTAFFALLHLPRERIRTALRLIHDALVPGGRFAVAMVEADVDDVPIAFLDSRIRVTGFLREDLRTVLSESGFVIEHEQVLSYAPETSSAQPEIQMFFLCQKADEQS